MVNNAQLALAKFVQDLMFRVFGSRLTKLREAFPRAYRFLVCFAGVLWVMLWCYIFVLVDDRYPDDNLSDDDPGVAVFCMVPMFLGLLPILMLLTTPSGNEQSGGE